MRSLFVFLSIWLSIQLCYAQSPRFISLAPSLTQNLYLLGVEANVVGYTSYCKEAVLDDKPIVASAVKVNLEKVATLRPDLVFTTTITNPETIQQLRSFGIRVEVLPTPGSFDEICAQFLMMGKIVGKEFESQDIVRKAYADVNALRAKTKDLPTARMFFQVGSNPLYCVPPQTFMNDFIQFAGGVNVCTTPSNGSISREAVLVRNPEVIFITTMGIVGAEEKKVWESYIEMDAVKNKKVFILDSNEACSPTPQTFVKTLQVMVDLLIP